MNIKKATIEEKVVLNHLMQYYFYDFSEFINIDVEKNGKFEDYPYLDLYWADNNRYPYLIEENGEYAGFVLVRRDEAGFYSIAEFFIMKMYRRLGLGKKAAHHIFDLHKGEWEVYQIQSNKPAQKFWKQVIGEYTNNLFEEIVEETKVIQKFHSQKL